jgi:hypothetical protein
MSEDLMTFRCLSCGEYINTGMTKCRFCSAHVDANAARAASFEQDKVNNACSEASYIKTVAVVLAISCGLSLVPIPFFNNVAFFFFGSTYLAVPVMVLRWQFKFGRLRSTDPDYARAKKVRNIALVLWGVASIPVVLWFLVMAPLVMRRFR